MNTGKATQSKLKQITFTSHSRGKSEIGSKLIHEVSQRLAVN